MPGAVVNLLNLLNLPEEQRAELEAALRRHPKSSMRERAATLLKLDEGHTYAYVAYVAYIAYVVTQCLLRPHSPDTLHDWVVRYKATKLQSYKATKLQSRGPSRPSRSSWYRPQAGFSPSAQDWSRGEGSFAAHNT
jgi:hypothetical protein